MQERRLSLSALAKELPNNRGVIVPRRIVTGITCDSRQVQPGSLFVAVNGTRMNGAEFAADAVERGAAAVVSEQALDLPEGAIQFKVKDTRRALAALATAFYGRPSHDLAVVGVTGTNGKTTTTLIVRAIIEAAGDRCGIIGSIWHAFGTGAMASTMTTPDAPDLQRMLREMADAGLSHAVMEVSSHALDQHRTDFVRFDAGLFTNLSGDHLDYHGTLDEYRAAKGRLFRSLRPGAWAVFNDDDENAMEFASPAGKIWYGIGARQANENRASGYTLVADNVRSTLNGSTFGLRFIDPHGKQEGAVDISMPLIGRYNVSNALAAAGAGLALGYELEHIASGLAAMDRVPGRLEPVTPARGSVPFHVLVDYAHTHDALDCVLRALKPLAPGRLIVVFGAGGDRDRTKRPKMGAAVEKWADLAWITSDNPRSEDPEEIIKHIEAGISRKGKFQREADRQAAIEQAVRCAQPGDLVLIAGKGHETTQKVADRVIEFDDREVARDVLNSLRRQARASV